MRTICWFYSYLYIDLKILTSMYIKGYLTKLEWGGGGGGGGVGGIFVI